MTPGMRVLDLGCGKALTSVFLAREFDVHVVAADLWTPVDDNWKRIVEAEVAPRVMPMHLEAHALPFAASYFDAIISVDAFAYFGTDVLYLHYFSGFLRCGGQLGIATPGLTRELPSPMPSHPPFPSDAEALEADQGRHIGFIRAIATRNDVGDLNLYDADLVNKVETASTQGGDT